MSSAVFPAKPLRYMSSIEVLSFRVHLSGVDAFAASSYY